jgi:hypothetical protein
MADWTICLPDESGSYIMPGHPAAGELADLPEWRVLVDPAEFGDVLPGEDLDEWGLATYGHGLTYDEAVELAQALGLRGVPIGG